jgi:glycosyltransferase involved in cell wall biosynthesis
MLNGLRITVVLPAYNASKTLDQTIADIPRDLVDEIILVDDHSQDDTVAKARHLGIETHQHPANQGYGGNQKTCYRLALQKTADIVVMLHPDYQYTPKLLRAMCAMIADGAYDVVLGSRILTGGALQGGMPLYKYLSNRVLTLVENWLLGAKLSEYHTGYRAYRREVLGRIPFEKFSNDFIFDNQFLIAVIQQGWRLGELSCPTRYFPEASSINFGRSLRYGLLCLWYALLASGSLLPRRLQRLFGSRRPD